MAMLSLDPAARPSAVDVQRHLGDTPDVRDHRPGHDRLFIGREPELQALQATFARVLLEAMRLSSLGQGRAAARLFACAIERARLRELHQDAALCCELLSEHHERMGERQEARGSLRRCRELYLAWGATARLPGIDERLRQPGDRPA
jgi:hypothetical protein